MLLLISSFDNSFGNTMIATKPHFSSFPLCLSPDLALMGRISHVLGLGLEWNVNNNNAELEPTCNGMK